VVTNHAFVSSGGALRKFQQHEYFGWNGERTLDPEWRSRRETEPAIVRRIAHYDDDRVSQPPALVQAPIDQPGADASPLAIGCDRDRRQCQLRITNCDWTERDVADDAIVNDCNR